MEEIKFVVEAAMFFERRRGSWDSTRDKAIVHFLQEKVDRALEDFIASMGPTPVEFDPEFDVDIAQSLKTFEQGIPGAFAEPFVDQLRENLQALVTERRRVNDALGDSIANWRDVLHRGCKLLASKRIGARIVVERRQDLGPFLTTAGVIPVNPPVFLWLCQCPIF